MDLSGPARWWLISLKVFFLFLLQLAVLLPVWLVTDPTQTQQVVLIIVMLLPYVIYPIIWAVGILFDVFLVEDWFTPTEVYVVGTLAGTILPAAVLTPKYFHLNVPDVVLECILAFIILLPSVWIPLLAGYAWAPVVVAQRIDQKDIQQKMLTPASAESPLPREPSGASPSTEDAERREMRWIVMGLVAFVSFPLGFFVPLYLGTDPNAGGSSTMVFLTLLAHLIAFQYIVAPRLGLFGHIWLKSSSSTDVPEAVFKLLYGGAMLPTVILLPLYLHTSMHIEAQKTLLFFLLGLPPVYVLEAVRTSHRANLAQLPVSLAMVYFGLVMPVGVLLPAWLAAEPDSTGQAVFLSFMLAPVTVCLLFALVFTAFYEARLPFVPLDALLREHADNTVATYSYAVSLSVAPVVVLLPTYFEGDLADTPKLITISFMGILTGILIVMFVVSRCRGGTAGPTSTAASVPNLPFASRGGHSQAPSQPTAVSRGLFGNVTMGNTAGMAAASFNAAQQESRTDSVSPGLNYGDNDNSLLDTPGMMMPSLSPTDFAEPVQQQDTRLHGRSASVKSEVWQGWEVGMRCLALHGASGALYAATIRTLDWDKRTATVDWDRADFQPERVPMSKMYDNEEPAEPDDAVAI
eukprot:m.56015 g.56015  ORF g.56015 m.56015 type:complete len:634 (-) comp15560_c1_seq1:3683-5584(-)